MLISLSKVSIGRFDILILILQFFELSPMDFPLYVIVLDIVKAKSFLVPVGNLNLCPNAIRNLQEHGTRNLRQHGQFCYELRTETDDWMSASSDCFSNNNGFLVQIMSQQDQNFIMNFLREENVHVPVWIGLNDRGRGMEEHFNWDSGKAVSLADPEGDGVSGPPGKSQVAIGFF